MPPEESLENPWVPQLQANVFWWLQGDYLWLIVRYLVSSGDVQRLLQTCRGLFFLDSNHHVWKKLAERDCPFVFEENQSLALRWLSGVDLGAVIPEIRRADPSESYASRYKKAQSILRQGQASGIFENFWPSSVTVQVFDVDNPRILQRHVVLTAWCVLTNPDACIVKLLTNQKVFVRALFVSRVDQPQGSFVYTRTAMNFGDGCWEPCPLANLPTFRIGCNVDPAISAGDLVHFPEPHLRTSVWMWRSPGSSSIQCNFFTFQYPRDEVKMVGQKRVEIRGVEQRPIFQISLLFSNAENPIQDVERAERFYRAEMSHRCQLDSLNSNSNSSGCSVL